MRRIGRARWVSRIPVLYHQAVEDGRTGGYEMAEPKIRPSRVVGGRTGWRRRGVRGASTQIGESELRQRRPIAPLAQSPKQTVLAWFVPPWHGVPGWLEFGFLIGDFG